jgi:hypothetical protein
MLSFGRVTIAPRTPTRGGWFGKAEAWLNGNRFFTLYKLGPVAVCVWPS